MPIEVQRLRAIVIILLVVSVLAIGVVFVLYLRAWLNARRAGRGKVGLTPLHVALVSLSTLDLQVTLAWGLSEGYSGVAPTPGATMVRTIMYGLGSLGILAALFVIGSLQTRRRVRITRRRKVVVDNGEQLEVDPD